MPQQRRTRFLDLTKGLQERQDRRIARLIEALVDPEFYFTTYPDVKEAGMGAALHYARYGWREGRDPSRSFSTKGYLKKHPVLVQTGENPLAHFIANGEISDKYKSSRVITISDEVKVVALEFDATFYLRTYPDAMVSNLDPIEHYCETGWIKGYDPSLEFSTSHYLTENPDVKESGVNPFWHFISAGRDEGRAPRQLGGWQREVISNLGTLDQIKDNWLNKDAPPKTADTNAIFKLLSANLSKSELVVSVGHDDYRNTPGGVQLCIGLEAQRAKTSGVDYLNIHPWQPLPTLAEEFSDPIVCAVLNGRALCRARMSHFVDAMSRTKSVNSHLVIHQLAGHSLELLIELARSIGLDDCHLWLHDNFSLCTNFVLQRNNVSYCGAPTPDSNACNLCVYGDERKKQSIRFDAFFGELDVHVVAPSQVALDLWQRKGSYNPKSTQVHPHLVLKKRTNRREVMFPDCCRIAFVGLPAAHKGWPVFKRLQEKLASDPRFEFYLFSASKVPSRTLHHVPVHVDSNNPMATIDALRTHKIDIVIHWAMWPETFSFSTFEAIAAGALVITNEASGNVAATIENENDGLVLALEEDLYALVEDDKLFALAEVGRKARGEQETDVVFSGFSIDLLSPHAAAA